MTPHPSALRAATFPQGKAFRCGGTKVSVSIGFPWGKLSAKLTDEGSNL